LDSQKRSAPADAEEGSRAPLAPCAGVRPRHAPARPTRRRRGHIALQILHALIFDFLNYASGRAGPVLCGDRPQGERVRARGCHGAEAPPGAGDPQLGATVRPELAERVMSAFAPLNELRSGHPVWRSGRLQDAESDRGSAHVLPAPGCSRNMLAHSGSAAEKVSKLVVAAAISCR
jgi:hypothetical protein